jgi:hypothetical protein
MTEDKGSAGNRFSGRDWQTVRDVVFGFPLIRKKAKQDNDVTDDIYIAVPGTQNAYENQ